MKQGTLFSFFFSLPLFSLAGCGGAIEVAATGDAGATWEAAPIGHDPATLDAAVAEVVAVDDARVSLEVGPSPDARQADAGEGEDVEAGDEGGTDATSDAWCFRFGPGPSYCDGGRRDGPGEPWDASTATTADAHDDAE
jgi:hypothetical protein